MDLDDLGRQLSDVLTAHADTVAGAVVGVAVGDDQVVRVHGSANLNTAQPFTSDTGWLLGSVTKLLTATMLLRLVGQSAVDLDAPVTDYLPGFRLATDGLAERISVRMLVNHSNGIDADTLMPAAVRGRDAGRSYEKALAGFGTLFEPGKGVHYSNPGFVLAGRIVEEVTGAPFERAIADEVFGPCGMVDATAVQTQAFLRSTAVGAFAAADGSLQTTSMFTLPESGAAAGSTAIVTVDDMLAFGRTHLNEGVSPTGERVLSASLVEAMRRTTVDLGIAPVPPVGLGWWKVAVADTVALWHGGGSPGGGSSFCILPEHDAVIVSFASGIPGSGALNDALHSAVIRHLTGKDMGLPFEPGDAEVDPADVVGTYTGSQNRVDIELGEGDRLTMRRRWEFDEEHRDTYAAFMGSVDAFEAPAVALCPVAARQYAPEGVPLTAFAGFGGRGALTAFVPEADGRPAGMHCGGRFSVKVS